MPSARIRSLEFTSAGLKAGLEDGKESVFAVATADQPALWAEDAGFSFGAPVLFVRRLDQGTVAEAAQAMAAEMSGYWLRYYNSPGELAPGGAPKRARRAPGPRGGVKVVSTAISEAYPPRSPGHGCAAIQVRIEDGREFSLLTATPSWFEKAFVDLELPYYFGPCVLFVKNIEPKLVRRAVKAIAAEGDRWLCRYDTPRRTLPEVLADFAARHARGAAR